MSADVVPPAGGKLHAASHPETIAGQRRPPTKTSSPNPKSDREVQHMKKRVKQTEPPAQAVRYTRVRANQMDQVLPRR
ncbi:unnamed protein product [Linum trigynum]|uniref:Uncharacterized protein n=1 Tax=Linum trigynum TaxID=586398 RepID=A0AAV2GI99_9ROSI